MHKVPDQDNGSRVEKAFLADALDVHSLLHQEPDEFLPLAFGQFEYDLHVEHITIKIGLALVNDSNNIPPTSDIGCKAATSWPGESFISSFMETCTKPPDQ
jgi:hypothetical protein